MYVIGNEVTCYNQSSCITPAYRSMDAKVAPVVAQAAAATVAQTQALPVPAAKAALAAAATAVMRSATA